MKEQCFKCLFRVMLTLLSWRIAWKIGRSDRLNQLLTTRENIIIFGVLSDRPFCVYHFIGTEFKKLKQTSSEPTLTILFASAEVAIKTVLSRDLNRFMAAIQNRDIVVTGDYSQMMWFISVMKAALRR